MASFFGVSRNGRGFLILSSCFIFGWKATKMAPLVGVVSSAVASGYIDLVANPDRILLGERFSEALAYAAELHAAQTRKAKPTPYVAHLMAVSSMVLECGGGEDEAIAALLHDAAEDQGGQATLDEIRRRFGPRVAGIVEECSDSLVDADHESKRPWQQRKEEFLARLVDASPGCRLVTSCDKLHNLSDVLADYEVVGEGLWDRFSGGREGSAWYYREIARILRDDGHRAARELVRASARLDQLLGLGKQVR